MDTTAFDTPRADAMPRGLGLVGRTRAPRVVGLAFGSLCAGAGLYQADAPSWVWALMLLYCFAWPHVAYHTGVRAASPFEAAHRHALVDSLAGGFWAVAMAFNVLPSILILTTLAMNNFATGGAKLAGKGMVAQAAGACAALLTVGLQFQPESSFLTILLCIPFLLSYPLMLGVVMYRLSMELNRRKNVIALEKGRAEEANLAKSRFLAAASHDLRQPLQALSLFSGTLLELGLKGRQREVASQMSRSIASLEDMFDDLLDISKLDAGHVSSELSHFPIQRLLDTLDMRFGPLARSKRLAMTVRPCHVVVLSDPQLLQRVLDNLVANAIRFTEAGSVLVSWRIHDASLRIEVCDTGCGIPPEQQQHIFEEFFQVDPAKQAQLQRGLGLGLSIASRTASLLSTRIEVRSTPGLGSVFAITVPRGDPVMVRSDRPDPAEMTDVLAGKQVLVIDDDPSIRDGMRELMSRWHCRVIVAESGGDALAKVAQSSAVLDLIIADYHIPEGGDGVQAIELLRERLGCHVPALIITGDATPEQLAGLSSRVNVLRKPVRPTQLRAHCAALLGKP